MGVKAWMCSSENLLCQLKVVLLVTTAHRALQREEAVHMLIIPKATWATLPCRLIAFGLTQLGIPEQGQEMFTCTPAARWATGVKLGATVSANVWKKVCPQPRELFLSLPAPLVPLAGPSACKHHQHSLSHSLTSTCTYLHDVICTTLQITSEFGPQFATEVNRSTWSATNDPTAQVCYVEYAALIHIRC